MSLPKHLPSFHVRPSLRLEKPISLTRLTNHPTAPMNKYHFHPVSLRLIRTTHELVYDPNTNLRARGPIFSADFESGNLGQVYKIGPRTYEIHLLPDPTRQYSALWYFFKVADLTPGEYIFHIVGFFRDEHQHDLGVLPTAFSEALAEKEGIGWQRIGSKINFWCAKNNGNTFYCNNSNNNNYNYNDNNINNNNNNNNNCYSNYNMNKNTGSSGSNSSSNSSRCNMNNSNINFGNAPEYALTFSFTVNENDTMYFSYLYPYTYSDLVFWIGRLRRPFMYSILCSSPGGVDVPVLFWDADIQRCVNVATIKPSRGSAIIKKKPLIIIAARLHPGESNSSYAMEGFMAKLFSSTPSSSSYGASATSNNEGQKLRRNFSFLILPMVNPDGVICGYYRPTLHGYDANRVWKKPDRSLHPIAHSFMKLLDVITQTKPPIFVLDYHGHTAQANAFAYGINNPKVYLNEMQSIFPKIMALHCPIFDEPASFTYQPNEYSTTMRVALHHRYKIPFAYTLEMSFGAQNIGPDKMMQITPNQYKQVGQATVSSLASMLFENVPVSSFVKNYVPQVFESD